MLNLRNWAVREIGIIRREVLKTVFMIKSIVCDFWIRERCMACLLIDKKDISIVCLFFIIPQRSHGIGVEEFANSLVEVFFLCYAVERREGKEACWNCKIKHRNYRINELVPIYPADTPGLAGLAIPSPID